MKGLLVLVKFLAQIYRVGREVGRGFRMGGGRDTHVYLWPIHVDIWQKPSQ